MRIVNEYFDITTGEKIAESEVNKNRERFENIVDFFEWVEAHCEIRQRRI